MGKIIRFPDDKKLREKLRRLKEILEELLLERDNLKFVICKNIETQYMLTFGSLEYKVFNAFCNYHRLRRKKDLIQVRINRREKIDLYEIDKILDEEFLAYKKELDEKIDQINKAIKFSLSEILSEEETVLIKKLYRKIVRNLHPDLNPQITDREKELFYNATEAYKAGDLESILIIFDIVSENINNNVPLTGKSLIDELKRLEESVKKIQNSIDEIKSSIPYIWKIYVEDENKKKEKLNKLKNQLKSYEEAIRTQEEYMKEMLRDFK